MKVEIEKLDHQGRGIGRIQNKIIFIENALPNEIVDVKIIKEKKNYMEGIVLKYLEKSSKRVQPKCPYYELCGGCNLMHLNYNDQLEYKQNKIQNIIDKFYREKVQINKIIESEQFYYRNKATFQVDNKIGYYKNKTNEVLEIKKCLIVDKRINEILKQIKEYQSINQIVIRSGDKESLVVFKGKNYQENLNSNVLNLDGKYKLIKGKDYILDKIGRYQFIISAASFFQVNTKQAEKMYDLVLKYMDCSKKDHILDLYCGTGTIGLYLSEFVDIVLGVEINKFAIEDANKNKKLNNVKNIEFRCMDASNIAKIQDKFNKVVVDPPRSGLDSKTINYLMENNFERIIYVSCDPITLARDLNLLKNKYSVKEIAPVDMFPNTYHVETVSVLHRKITEK